MLLHLVTRVKRQAVKKQNTKVNLQVSFKLFKKKKTQITHFKIKQRNRETTATCLYSKLCIVLHIARAMIVQKSKWEHVKFTYQEMSTNMTYYLLSSKLSRQSSIDYIKMFPKVKPY